ncbi:hypothetical protein OG792_12770 [Micromonospora sp. NBC_01699]|uniref:hypothetical protein n=1 Tax=Micromonospora sp. NBC_01699 TaxID=2975984 RepID=UPI002E340A45|nr:hypothetical protein [Micromonospora sp. NBC_01699]
MIDQVKAAVEGCKEYEDSGDQVKVLGPVELPRYPRTEARFGFCYSTTPADGGEAYIACDAYIARDHVVSSVTVVRGDDQESSRLGVLFVGALAAEALAKVV